jgi:small subunit ribosomal protein S17
MPRRILRGKVSSLKNANTAVVLVERTLTHELLNRTIKRSKKYHVNCSTESLAVGQDVLIQEAVAVSKLKRWALVKSSV